MPFFSRLKDSFPGDIYGQVEPPPVGASNRQSSTSPGSEHSACADDRDGILLQNRQQKLCKGCKKAFKSWKRLCQDRTRMLQLRSQHIAKLLHLKTPTCAMCKFLLSMRWENDKDGCYNLMGFSSKYLLRSKEPDILDNLLLGVVPRERGMVGTPDTALYFSRKTGFIAPSEIRKYEQVQGHSMKAFDYSIRGRMIDSHDIDFSLLRSWLEISDQRHDDEIDEDDEQPKSIPMDLINVHSRAIVAEPTKRPKFAALSYVWGDTFRNTAKEIEEREGQKYIPSNCSQTIEDAIVVTKNLGLQYLWVDLYCVSRDPSMRHTQIAMMDAIYKSAYFTIVAAAGNDADYGLPGVSRPRSPQLGCRLGKYYFVSVRLDALYDLDKSKYSTRAWTYQEKLFSDRCLVFTEHQAFYDSPESLQLETLSSPVHWKTQYISYATQKHLQLDFRNHEEQEDFGINGAFSMKPVSLPYEECALSVPYREPDYLSLLEQHIQQYSNRNLTYDFDALNAIKAILERFEIGERSIGNACGVPSSFGSEPIFGYGLSWTHADIENPRRRRLDFPSWSWAGWAEGVRWFKGECRFHGAFSDGYFSAECKYGKSSLCCACPGFKTRKILHGSSHFSVIDSDNLLGPDRYHKFQAKDGSTDAKFLYITADSLIVDFVGSAVDVLYLAAGLDRILPFYARLHVSQWDMRPDLKEQSSGRLVAIKLAEKHRYPVSDSPCEVHLLIITEPKGENNWCERVGILKAPLKWYERQTLEKRSFLLR